MQSILVVDDDPILRKLLKKALVPSGYKVEVAADWTEMSAFIGESLFDLYVLDINLPGLSGLEICESLRNQDDQTPIIMLTARGEDNDRIRGLEAGADDYLPKPFNAHELLARIKAVLRRHAYVPQNATAQTSSFSIGSFAYDGSHNSLSRDGALVPLTSHELAILKILYQYRGRPVSRTLMNQHLHGVDYQPDQRAIDLLVSKLRKSLGDTPPNFGIIQTIRGKGYMLVNEHA
jgi:two-component system phosphate regulon response regulator OmpR